MRAIILSAGYGVRMQPLSNDTPKPLLTIHGKPIMAYHIQSLRNIGIERIVINHARLGEKIEAYFGDGHEFGVDICYSPEGNTPLDTGGGILNALTLLGNDPFIVVNGDVHTDFNFSQLPNSIGTHAHLVMVNNPPHNPQGDFSLEKGLLKHTGEQKLTYSGIGLYHPKLFDGQDEKIFSVTPLLKSIAEKDLLSGQFYDGYWQDIGTPDRLAKANAIPTII